MHPALDLLDLRVFPKDFIDWIPHNWHVYDAFVGEAFNVIDLGFKHYSSRTIIHFLRHHSAVREQSGWKLNNDHSPYLARLFDLQFPHLTGLWEYRDTPKTRSYHHGC